MSYKLSFQSENALPSLVANQGQNAIMLFSIANPHSFAGPLVSCFAFSSVQGWRGRELKVHENGQASERMQALCSSGPFQAAQRYTSCCTDAFGTKTNEREVQSFFSPFHTTPNLIKLKALSYLTVKTTLWTQDLKLSSEPQTCFS